MSKLTVYKVSWTSPYSSRDYSEIFISFLEAKVFLEIKKKDGAVDIKLSKVTDIWEFTARNFSKKISSVIETRLKDDGSVEMWKDDILLKEELVELASAAGIEDFSCECWSVFETEYVEVFALSCAWTYRNKLYHYTDTLEVF